MVNHGHNHAEAMLQIQHRAQKRAQEAWQFVEDEAVEEAVSAWHHAAYVSLTEGKGSLAEAAAIAEAQTAQQALEDVLEDSGACVPYDVQAQINVAK